MQGIQGTTGADGTQGGTGGYFRDPYWPYVTTLLRFNGTDASTTITDECGWVWTANGDAQLDTAQSKFGGSSLLCDGTGDYVSTPDNSLHEMALNDFTIEAWVRIAAMPASGGYATIWNKRASVSAVETWGCIENVSGTTYLRGTAWISSVAYTVTGTTALSVDTWYHVALERVGPTMTLYLDGGSEGIVDLGTGSIGSSNGTLTLGRDNSNTARDWNGWIDSFRMTRGAARYRAAFTPPTADFPVLGEATGATPIYVQETEPSSPPTGALWFW